MRVCLIEKEARSAVISTQTTLPSCSQRVLQAALSLLSKASVSQWRRARLYANLQYTVAQVHQVFLNFANRCSLFLPRSLRPRDFPKGKTQKTAGAGREQLEQVLADSPPAGLLPSPLCPTRFAPFSAKLCPLLPGIARPPIRSPRGEQTQLTSLLQSLFKTVSKVTNYRASYATGSSEAVSLQINCNV